MILADHLSIFCMRLKSLDQIFVPLKYEENVKKKRVRTSQLFAFHFIKSENPIN